MVLCSANRKRKQVTFKKLTPVGFFPDCMQREVTLDDRREYKI